MAATVAVLDGRLKAGLTDDELQRIADEDIAKLSVRDLPIALGRGSSGATTVAATSVIADLAGIRVFATGGLGGVHRKAAESFDESADLSVLAGVPITVVSAGVKSILDIGATLERLETLSVPVLGYGTDRFPSFWLTDSGHELDWRVTPPPRWPPSWRLATRWASVPGSSWPIRCPRSSSWIPRCTIERSPTHCAWPIEQGLVGKDVTPFLLQTIVDLTGGDSLAVNLLIAENNIQVAAGIAQAWADR